MPEEPDTTTSSGKQPEPRKPTVIGAGQPAPPNPAPQGVRPTVIGVCNTAPSWPTQLVNKPTVIGGGQPPPATALDPATSCVTPAPQRPAPTPIHPTPPDPIVAKVVTTPSAMPGVVRKGLEVSDTDISKAFPGTHSEVIAKVRNLLSGVIIDSLSDTQCVRWGEEDQRRFGELTNQSLELLGSSAIKDGERHLGRLHEILQGIGQVLQGNRKLWSKPDPKKQFEEGKPELLQLSKLLDGLLPQILDVRLQLETVSRDLQGLIVMLDGLSIAAHYLADLFQSKTDRPQALSALLGRSASLQETIAHIQQGEILRNQNRNDLQQLVVRIQEGVLNALPAWMESTTITLQRSNLTETDLYGVRQGLDGLLLRVKG